MGVYDPVLWGDNITGSEKIEIISSIDPFGSATRGSTLDGYLQAEGGQIHQKDARKLRENVEGRSGGAFKIATLYSDGMCKMEPYHVIVRQASNRL